MQYDLYGYANDNGKPSEVKNSPHPLSWWDAGDWHTMAMNTVLLRQRWPDFFEIPCFDEKPENRQPNKVELNFTPYQREQVYDKGNAIVYPYQCKCGELKFVAIQPTSEVSKFAPEIGLHRLPPAVINSGPSPI